MVKIEGIRIKVRRRMLSISSIINEERDTRPKRSEIKCWNEGMGRRLGAYLDNFRSDFTGMVTLTYPQVYPKDGREVKQHLRAFIERLRRIQYFERHSLVWFMEFQERGAPHIHMLVTGWIGKDWVAQAWADITGGNTRACSRVEALRHARAAGAYARKYASKQNQKHIPPDFANVGRFWGCCGAKKLQELDRVPCVVASRPGATPAAYSSTLWSAAKRYRCRVVDTPIGFAVYGSEKGIFELWRYLRAVIAPTVHGGVLPGDLLHPTRAALSDM